MKNIITVSGASAVGKSFLIDSVTREMPSIKEIIGLTTRPLRAGEINGKSGVFMSSSEMEYLENTNKVVLVKKFFNYKYAWYKDDLVNKDEIRIINISYNSIQDLLDMGLNIYSIFVMPQSEDKMIELLRKRSLTEEDYKRRMNGYYESIEFLKEARRLFNLVFTNNYDESSKKRFLSVIQNVERNEIVNEKIKRMFNNNYERNI